MRAILITRHVCHSAGNWAAALVGRREIGIITEAAPSVSRLTFPLKLFIYNTEWMCGGQGKLAVNRHCQHRCLSATGNWQLYFCSYRFHLSSPLLLTVSFSFRSLSSIICLLSLVNRCGNMPHTLFWQPSFASLTLTQTCWLILASDESVKHLCELTVCWGCKGPVL